MEQAINTSTKKQSKISLAIDKYFHISERGSSIKQEIISGLSVFLLSLCVLLMQTRIIGEAISGDSLAYRGIYMAATIISFVGTLLIGLVARLPLIQTSSLGLSTCFVALIGGDNGLTYQNLLAISFISSILYTILVSIPKVRDLVYNALPKTIKQVLPVGMGLYIIFYALRDSGLLATSSESIYFTGFGNAGDGGALHILGGIALIVALVACLVFYKLKNHVSTPLFYGLLVGTMIFYLVGLGYGFALVFSVNRAYIALGAENMFTFMGGIEGLDVGSVFTEGFNFQGYTGSVASLWIYSLLTFLFMSMYESESNIIATGAVTDEEYQDSDVKKALICNASINVIAPIVGTLPVTVGKQSVGGKTDGAKTGLSSVVCSIGYLLMMFTWILFALFATFTQTVSEYGHSTSNSYAEYAQAVFGAIDGVMIFVGLLMMKNIVKIDRESVDNWLPQLITIATFAITQNIVYGIAFGVISYVIMRLFSFDKEKIKSITIETGVLSCLMLVVICLI